MMVRHSLGGENTHRTLAFARRVSLVSLTLEPAATDDDDGDDDDDDDHDDDENTGKTR